MTYQRIQDIGEVSIHVKRSDCQAHVKTEAFALRTLEERQTAAQPFSHTHTHRFTDTHTHT